MRRDLSLVETVVLVVGGAASAVFVVVMFAALTACSRPTSPHPETVAPPVDSPADEPVCHGDDCALPKPKR